MLTDQELDYCSKIALRVAEARTFLDSHSLSEPLEPTALFAFLSELREIQGNLSNDVSFAATLMAKAYLLPKFGLTFDAAEKAQGAPGLDIDVMAPDGSRVVGEIKTTVPYQGNDFGAQQAASFKKDFAKLTSAQAKHKFLFITVVARSVNAHHSACGFPSTSQCAEGLRGW